jgi:hypothetical protein
VRWLGRYLKATKHQGLINQPTETAFDIFIDADFAGNWDPQIAAYDDSTARSRHGYIITYAGCPILWASQLQTENALSSTESEFIGISRALRTAIPMMELMKELLIKQGFSIRSARPQVHCRVFEDNSVALDIAKVPKMRPRTKHSNIKYHPFRDQTTSCEVRSLYTPSRPLPTC